ncbi:hypothetical protein G9A89_015846 [Geosiphon pyriformis]|nr:hypothetical protein G9A89_015846 [Geosiphon pyriformis]
MVVTDFFHMYTNPLGLAGNCERGVGNTICKNKKKMEMAKSPYLSITQEVRIDKLELESHEILRSPRLGINEKEINNAQIAKRFELNEELKHLVIPRVNDKDYLDDVSDLTELGEDDDGSLETIMISPVKNEASVSASEKILVQLIITEEEKEANSEFLAAKTPEPYMKIRNYILNAWIEGKPNYVTTTSTRTGKFQFLLKQDDHIKDESMKKPWMDFIHLEISIIEKANFDDDWAQKRVNEKDLYNADSHGPRAMKSRSMSDLHPAPLRITITDTTMLVMDFHSHILSILK